MSSHELVFCYSDLILKCVVLLCCWKKTLKVQIFVDFEWFYWDWKNKHIYKCRNQVSLKQARKCFPHSFKLTIRENRRFKLAVMILNLPTRSNFVVKIRFKWGKIHTLDLKHSSVLLTRLCFRPKPCNRYSALCLSPVNRGCRWSCNQCAITHTFCYDSDSLRSVSLVSLCPHTIRPCLSCWKVGVRQASPFFLFPLLSFLSLSSPGGFLR